MKLQFHDEAFSFELLRAIGYSIYDGADIGECLATAGRIQEGDFEGWYREWAATAERVRSIADTCLTHGHRVNARKAYLRASNYYRSAEFFLHIDPTDPRILSTWENSRLCFHQATQLFAFPCEAVEIPYEGTTLPGYLYRVDASDTPRPTLIFHGGFDSTVEELYFAGAAAAIEHGYNCLTFDGPGQGRVIRQQHIPFRPDWEAVVTPIVDYAVRRSEIDAERLALMGMSQGGYFAPRAAAFEHRLRALIAYDGVFNCYDAFSLLMPPPILSLLQHEQFEAFDAVLQLLMTMNSSLRWGVTNGMWTYGVSTPRAWLSKVEGYTLEQVVDGITCPTLVLAAEKDQFFSGQPEKLYERLSCPKTFIRFTVEEGAEEHCHEGAMSLFHQRLFDWLDETLERKEH